MDELDQFLDGQHSDGATESSGVFTLSGEQALEKLARYALGWETAWVLKVVQAVVAGGASSLHVHVSDGFTEFIFASLRPWSLEELEMEPTSPSLEHLQRALWSCLHQNRVCEYRISQSREALVITATGSSRMSVGAESHCSLRIAHAQRYSAKELLSKGVVPAPGAEASLFVKPIGDQLRASAYACPIPLSLDATRLDNLLLSDTHGYAARGGVPLALLFCPGDLPGQNFRAQAFVEANQPDPLWGASKIKNHFVQGLHTCSKCAAACLVGLKVQNLGAECQFSPQSSRLYWVLDGIIVHSQALPIGESFVSCAVYASAQGLPHDLSGLKLVEGPELEQRAAQVRALVDPHLQSLEISEKVPSKKARSKSWTRLWLAGGGAGVIGGISVVAPQVTGAFFVAAVVCSMVAAVNSTLTGELKYFEAQESIQRTELPRLKERWGGPP